MTTAMAKQRNRIFCFFCSGRVEAKAGTMECPNCNARFRYDERLKSVFADTHDLRLPLFGTVCPCCGLLQSKSNARCAYCSNTLSSALQ